MDEDKVAAFLTALMKDQKAKMLPRFGNVRTRVLSGDSPSGSHRRVHAGAQRRADRHGHVSPMPLTPWSFHLMKDAKSPNLAKLWGYYATTAARRRWTRSPASQRVTSEGTGLWKLAQASGVVTQDYDFVQKNLKRLSKKYAQDHEGQVAPRVATTRNLLKGIDVRFSYTHHMPYTGVEKSGQDWPVANKQFDPTRGIQLYRDYIDNKVYAEECGFDWIGCNEHI